MWCSTWEVSQQAVKSMKYVPSGIPLHVSWAQMDHKQTVMATATKFPAFNIITNIQDDEDKRFLSLLDINFTTVALLQHWDQNWLSFAALFHIFYLP